MNLTVEQGATSRTGHLTIYYPGRVCFVSQHNFNYVEEMKDTVLHYILTRL